MGVVRRTLTAMTLLVAACIDRGDEVSAPSAGAFATDAQIFVHITQSDPFGGYALFPKADSVVSGTLNGSAAHQPTVRVSMNARALGALVSGELPSGGSFPDSSVIFKEIRSTGAATLYAVMLKDRGNPKSAGGWLWAEFNPDGSVFYSMTHAGSGCQSCHSLEQGASNDLVRTFERQDQ